MDEQASRFNGKRRERPLLLPCFYFIEIPLFGTAAVLAYMLHFTAVFKTYPTTYNPSDISLSRPYTPAENRTVSVRTVFIGTTIVPSALVLVVEFVFLVFAVCFKLPTDPPIGSTGCYIGVSIRRVIRFIGIYLFGLLVTSALADVLRKNGPMLSPHFLSVCKPENDRVKNDATILVHGISENSENPDPLTNEYRFFSDDCSTILGVEELKNARLESPSYFVCLTTYAAVYTLLYFRMIMTEAGPVAKTLVAWSSLSFPYAIGLLETAENTSHLTSVICGWIMGAAVAYLMSHEIFSSNFIPRCKCPEICKRKSNKNMNMEANNVFEDSATPKFSIHKYKVATDDVISVSSNRDDQQSITLQVPQAVTHQTPILHSPAVGKESHSSCDHTDVQHEGHSAERKVIKELQNYMTETDFRGGLESPRPTQIRELTKSLAKNRKQVFSTFQATPELEVNDAILVTEQPEQNIPDDLHGSGSATDSPASVMSANFQKSHLIEIRPVSYHDHRSTQSSYGPQGDSKLFLPANEGRALSYSFLPGDLCDSWKHDNASTRETAGTDQSDFSSDGESDLLTLKGSSLDASPRVNDKDVVNETSNLLREVFEVTNDKGEEKNSDSDAGMSSDDSITEDQPSIIV